MVNILLYVSSLIIIFSFVIYFLMLILTNNKINKSNGFDITKDIISEYNSINVIESKGYITNYNIKRRVIKLSTKVYYGNKVSDIALALIEAGISIIDNNGNRFISFMKNIFSSLKILYIFPIISVMINFSTYNISDAKTSIVFVSIFIVLSYFMIDAKEQACCWVKDKIIKIKELNKNSSKMLINYINKLLLLDKFIFLGELTIILRCIAILLKFN